MSAFILSHKHINALLSYASRQRLIGDIHWENVAYSFTQIHDLRRMAEILLAENIRSVNTRYPDTIADPLNAPGRVDELGKPIIFTFTPPISNIQAVKACDCYDYQACETPDYQATLAARIVDHIRRSAITQLPGYDEAKWEIE